MFSVSPKTVTVPIHWATIVSVVALAIVVHGMEKVNLSLNVKTIYWSD